MKLELKKPGHFSEENEFEIVFCTTPFYSGTHFTNVFFIIIQIQLNIHYPVTPFLVLISMQNFAHAMTTQLWCHVQNSNDWSIGIWMRPKWNFDQIWNVMKQGKSEGFDSCDRPSNLKLDSNRQFFPCVTVTFVGWPRKTIGHFFYTTSSFVHHFKLDFTVQKHSIRVDIGEMLSRVTLKFDGWPWQTIGHLFYATSSFVQHFVAIGEFKLELQSGKAQFGSNSDDF